MSTATKPWKASVTASKLTVAIFFSTYFLSVQLIELSLSTYVSQDKNKAEAYRGYLLFKREAPIWKYWQIFGNLMVLLSFVTSIISLIEMFTKQATIKRNFLDIVKAIQVFTALYIAFTQILPLESQFIQTPSKDLAKQLNFFQWIIFTLSIIGFFVPIFQYVDGKNKPVDTAKDKKE